MLKFVRDAGETRRYHGRAVIRSQNVAEHSFHVAMIVAWLYRGKALPSKMLMAALTHDLAEHKLGDLPAPAKRSLPSYGDLSFREVWDGLEADVLKKEGLYWEANLSPEERRVLKLADAAEGCMYCIRERAMGNKLIDEVYETFLTYTKDLVRDARDLELIDHIEKEWEFARS